MVGNNGPGQVGSLGSCVPGTHYGMGKVDRFEDVGAGPVGNWHEHGVGGTADHGRVALRLGQRSELPEASEDLFFCGLLDKTTPVLEGDGSKGCFVGTLGKLSKNRQVYMNINRYPSVLTGENTPCFIRFSTVILVITILVAIITEYVTPENYRN